MAKTVTVDEHHKMIVSEEDYGFASQNKWRMSSHKHQPYVQLYGTTYYAHRLIAERASIGINEDIDHINGDTLDNRRSNLRAASRKDNIRNQKTRSLETKTSKFKGVSWFKRDSCWLANIHVDYKTKNLGYYTTEEDAARAYDRAALKFFGAFARTNFPRSDYE
jgi:HNH endonuclease